MIHNVIAVLISLGNVDVIYKYATIMLTERFLDDLRKHLRKILNLTNRKLQKFIMSAFK